MDSLNKWVYCDECYYYSDICPGDIKCRDSYTQEIDNGCTCGRPLTDKEIEQL